MSSQVTHLWQTNKYLWMSLAFALAYVPAAQALGRLLVSPEAAWTIFGIGVLNGGLRSWIGYQQGGDFGSIRRSLYLASWAFTMVDILLVGIAVRVTGGLASELWLLYFVVVLSESLYAPPAQVRIIALLVSLSYVFAAAAPFSLAHTVPLASRLFMLTVVGAYARRISYTAEEKNREVLLLREQVSASEERSRISREIHDSLGHAMTSAILRLELCRKLLKRSPAEAEEILGQEIPSLREAWNEGRDLAFHLRPWELSAPASLEETLRRHIGRFAERTGLVIDLTTKGSLTSVRPETAYALTRIVQEALTNAVKHAEATKIEVSLQNEKGEILLCIEDNGKGFDPASAQTGVGLNSIQERVAALNGTAEVTSTLGGGTRLWVKMKIQ